MDDSKRGRSRQLLVTAELTADLQFVLIMIRDFFADAPTSAILRKFSSFDHYQLPPRPTSCIRYVLIAALCGLAQEELSNVNDILTSLKGQLQKIAY